LPKEPLKESGFFGNCNPGVDRDKGRAEVTPLKFDEVFACGDDGAGAKGFDGSADAGERSRTIGFVVREDQGHDFPVPPKGLKDRAGIAGSHDIDHWLVRDGLGHTKNLHPKDRTPEAVFSKNLLKVSEGGFGKVLRTGEEDRRGAREGRQRLAKGSARQAVCPEALGHIVENDISVPEEAPVLEAIVKNDAVGRVSRFGEEQPGRLIPILTDRNRESKAVKKCGLITEAEWV
jgi:hypothetical protein